VKYATLISDQTFCYWQEDISGDFRKGEAACMVPSTITKMCSFFTNWKCARKIFFIFVTLSNLKQVSYRAATHFYKMYDN